LLESVYQYRVLIISYQAPAQNVYRPIKDCFYSVVKYSQRNNLLDRIRWFWWQGDPILDDDIEIVRTLGVACDRKVFFCRSIEMACCLYEYYEDALEKSVYNDPSGGPVPSNRLVAMYHSESAPSGKNAVSSSLMELCVECLLNNPLVWGYIARTSGKLKIGEYHETLEQYFQECGLAGWDNLPAKALLHTSARLCDKFCSKAVIDYCINSMCYCY